MNAVTSALAQRARSRRGGGRDVAEVVDTFVRAIETANKQQDNSDGDDYEEPGDYEEIDDCDS
jgi:hypothetical protein